MPLTIERKLPLILFFVVIVLTVLGFVFYHHTTRTQDAVTFEKQTQDVISKLDDSLRLISDSEAALSSFVITGNDTYLEPYNRAKTRIPQNIAQARTLVGQRAGQFEEIDRLAGLSTQYINQVDRKIERRKTDGFEATVSSLSDSSERSLTANIRASIERLKTSENALLERREQDLDESFYRTIWVLILGCLAGIVALAMANILVSREITKRRDAENADGVFP